MIDLKFTILNLPNPPGMNIFRDNAGGFGTSVKGNELLLPIYLLYAASALENSNCDYEIIDAQANNYSIQRIKEEVKNKNPDILMSWLSLPSLYYDLKILNEIKNIKKDMLIIAWGPICNVMPKEILLKSNVDLIIGGEYPYYNTISEFLHKIKENIDFNEIPNGIFVRDGEIVYNNVVTNESKSLNNLSLEVYNKISTNRYLLHYEDFERSGVACLPLVIGTGCPYGCIYCPYPVGFGRRPKYKSIENIIREIEFLVNHFGIDGFLFRTQIFDRMYIIKLCEKIIERNLDVKWLIEARADLVSKEILQIMKKAGCFRIHFGVETGSSKLIKTFRHGLSLEKYKRAFQMCKELEILTTAHIIVGLPGENKKTLKDTIRFLYYLNPDTVDVHVLTPYPGTRLFEMATKKGLISTFDWSKYTGRCVIMRTDELTENELYKSAKEIKKKFRNFKLLHDPSYRKYYIRKLLKAYLQIPKNIFRLI